MRVLWSEGLEAAEVRLPWTEAWGKPQVSLRPPPLGSVHPLPLGEGLSSQHLGPDPRDSCRLTPGWCGLWEELASLRCRRLKPWVPRSL